MGEGHGEYREYAGMPENHDDDDEDDMALEQDPSHRFSRYQQKVGSGRFKRVYRGFDEKNGIDVAWSKIERHVNNMELDNDTMQRITSEMSKGLQLEHSNIIKCFRCDAGPMPSLSASLVRRKIMETGRLEMQPQACPLKWNSGSTPGRQV